MIWRALILDLSGWRKPEACGKTALAEVETICRTEGALAEVETICRTEGALAEVETICRTEGKKLGLEMACRQSNSEGALDTWIEVLPGAVRRPDLEHPRLRPYLDCAARRAARA